MAAKFNRSLVIQRFQQITGCGDRKAQIHVDAYIRACADQIIQNHFAADAGAEYYIKLTELQNQLSSVRVRGQRYYVWNTLQRLNERIFDVSVTGSHILEKITLAKLNYSPAEILELAGTPDENWQQAYKPYEREIQTGDYDLARVDVRSLRAFLASGLVLDLTQWSGRVQDEWNHRLKSAQLVLAMCRENPDLPPGQAELLQIRSPSEFGRLYYRGPNLQTVPKIVRHAALGDCHEYDIENSVVGWKLTQFQAICEEQGFQIPRPATLEYLDHKTAIRRRLARTLWGDQPSTRQLGIVKRFITAIGFGAVQRSEAWPNPTTSRGWSQPALNQIIQNQNLLQTALADPWVREFAREQTEMNQVIVTAARAQGAESLWRQVPQLWDAAGRPRVRSVIAWMYQHAEQALMSQVQALCEPSDILLQVHDCVYTRRPVPLAQLRELVRGWGEFYSVDHQEHQAWTWQAQEEAEHQARIQAEEQRAQELGWAAVRIRGRAARRPHTLRPGQGSGSGYREHWAESEWDPDQDPWQQDHQERPEPDWRSTCPPRKQIH